VALSGLDLVIAGKITGVRLKLKKLMEQVVRRWKIADLIRKKVVSNTENAFGDTHKDPR
jgi:hypothetical protein